MKASKTKNQFETSSQQPKLFC